MLVGKRREEGDGKGRERESNLQQQRRQSECLCSYSLLYGSAVSPGFAR
jgi:hypothetical protein